MARAGRWLAFVPFAVVAVLQLTSKVTDDPALDHLTKPLCVPLLAGGAACALLLARRRAAPIPTALLGLGLLLSALGDVLVETSVPLGLGAFLLAHLAYIGMLSALFRRRISRWALLLVPWYAVLVAVLAPHLGALLAPVLVYGAALGGMAASATRGGPATALGGVLFVVSDTLLAFQLFTPYLPGDLVELLIMLTYLAAQSLLTLGALGALTAPSTPRSPSPSRTRRDRAAPPRDR